MSAPKISPEKFLFEKYGLRRGFSNADVFDWKVDVNRNPAGHSKLQPGVTLIGWCDANRLRVRPRTEGYAIMVEIGGEEIWFHCDEHPDNL
jgi:hypothetical protein